MNNVYITPVIHSKWMMMVPGCVETVLRLYKEKGLTFSPSNIPDEQFRADSERNGEIFIEIPEIGFSLSLDVGPKEWWFIGEN